MIEDLLKNQGLCLRESKLFPPAWDDDPVIGSFRDRDFRKRLEMLFGAATLSWQEYMRAWESIRPFADLVPGQVQYMEDHKRRFFELFRALSFLLRGSERPRILDVGVSVFSRLFRVFLPQCYLVTLDRPVDPDYPGFRPEVVKEIIAGDDHIICDLRRVVAGDRVYERYCGFFDIVVFTEVLEHLDAHPVEVLEFLRELIRPQGWLYLTTPNFFRRDNCLRLLQGENPAAYHPRRGENWDAHHHYREYSMKELICIAKEAGLSVWAFYGSDCWDPEGLNLREEEKSNLVLICRK